MLLGNSGSDNFALFRRKRILDGNFNIPLNPGNPVLRQMHDQLAEQRTGIKNFIDRCKNQPKGTLAWMLHLFGQCPTLTYHHNDALDGFRQMLTANGLFNPSAAQAVLREWVNRGLDISRPVLEIRRHLDSLSEEFPTELQEKVSMTRDAVTAALAGEGDFDTVQALLQDVFDSLGKATFGIKQADRVRYNILRENINDLASALLERRIDGGLQEHERLYGFFYELSSTLAIE